MCVVEANITHVVNSEARDVGRSAEDDACAYLRESGYEIVARNWRTTRGEIDIVAREGPVLAFVEVKARSGPGFGGPEAAVHPSKQRRLIAAARAFLSETECALPSRFDVVAILDGVPSLHRDAFQADESCTPDS
jgi:putative endonuclease